MMTPATLASLDPYVRSEAAAARAMTDDEYWNWDRQYGAPAGVVPPALRDLTEQGSCGGGGCNPSFSNSQYWIANVACSADVYGRVLFQYRRYLAAQIRLTSLLNNPPQAWPGRMYFADTQDADGASTTLPKRPAGEQPLSTKAAEWASWCVEVMRHVAVAHWASGVRWCEGDRAPQVYGGFGNSGRIWATPESYGYARQSNLEPDPTRSLTPAEVGTVAGCIATDPKVIQALTERGSQENARYEPDAARQPYGSYHPIGYFRPTTPRGSAPARWTWGRRNDGSRIFPDWSITASEFRLFTHFPKMPKAVRGLSEIAWSPLPEADIFEAFREAGGYHEPLASSESGPVDPHRVYYTGTWLQLSECLATRHGNESGPHTFVMPEGKGDFDPVITPSLIMGGTNLMWPDDLPAPTDTSPEGLLTAIFQQATIQPSGLIDDHTLSLLRAQWQLHWSSGGFRFLPTGLRQIWWCMAQAYDVVDTTMGTAVAQAFANFLTGLNQLPPAYRVLNPTEGGERARNALQGSLDTIFAACSATATAITTVGTFVGGPVGIAIQVVGMLVAIAGALAQAAFSLGLARAGNPPVMPTIMHRVAGVENDPTDPCWLVQPPTAGAGGSSALAPKATAVHDAATRTQSPEQWYEQVRAAIAAGETPPPPTPAELNKGVALAGGTMVGLALIKILGG